ncbi:MFS transporter [Aestuariibacter halophilus]|uniref:MFS transporter n=1 Tax=Fluctibacter halophilus TaxID=226011 RepID=A0ABS8GCC2_9ALTE|nr:MFS transporter [Aestuariibacter halophilus]MCC2617891.1 MFS transporter [Aestuariibacter halophilus]
MNGRQQVWLLTVIQALAMSGGAMMALLGGVVGAHLAPQPSLSTLPLATMIIGTAVAVIPMTRAMARYGRQAGFLGSAGLAVTAALVAAYAVNQQAFSVFLAATTLLGFAISGFQQLRFAAMESVPVEQAPNAASKVLLGGLVAAFLGPELAVFGKLLSDVDYAGAFYALAMIGLLCGILFLFYRQPQASRVNHHGPVVVPSGTLTHPRFILALCASALGYGLMSFIMTATPVHMHVHSGHSLADTKWVIQSHIVAMFLPSLFSGWLIRQWGPVRVAWLGSVAYVLTIMMAFAGQAWMNYFTALVLLGIGWNFLFLGGTVILNQMQDGTHKAKVQGLHDAVVFSMQALASLGAGVVLTMTGWQGMLMISLLLLGVQALLMLWQLQRLRRPQWQLQEEN